MPPSGLPLFVPRVWAAFTTPTRKPAHTLLLKQATESHTPLLGKLVGFLCATVSPHAEKPWEQCREQGAPRIPVRSFPAGSALGTSREEILPQIFAANYKVLEKADFSSTEKFLF